MKRISHYDTARDKLLHIETDGAVINIKIGIHDLQNRECISVSIIPTTYEGWRLEGEQNNVLRKGIDYANI